MATIPGGDWQMIKSCWKDVVKLFGILAVATSLALSFAVHAEEPRACQYDRDAMLALEQRDFDQDPNNGWRALDRSGDCKLAAADLIRAYIEANGEKGHIMTWHEGQLRAMAGQTDRAIELFEAARKPADRDDWFGWNHYVDGTIAFLERDRDGLESARESLVSLPRPTDYNPVDSFGKPVNINWPPNLNVVNGLLECFDDSYDFAYNNCLSSFAIAAETCDRTTGSGSKPVAAWPAAATWFGSEQLAVQLPKDGVWSTTSPGHSLAVKLFWWRDGFEPGDESNLDVRIKRLDSGQNDVRILPPTNAGGSSLGAWTMLTGIDFPSAGCWQITGTYLDDKLTFIVETLAQ